jgi:hypothetical protein
MLLLALVTYLFVLLPASFVLRSVVDLSTVPFFAMVLILAFCSLGAAFLILFLVHSYQPDWKPFFRRLLRIRGIRGLAFVSFLASLAGLVLVFRDLLDPLTLYAIVPFGAISLLNSLFIEVLPSRYLKSEGVTRVVTLPEPKIPEIAEDILREFSWHYEGTAHDLSLVIRRSAYEEFKKRRRVHSSEWAKEYVAGGVCGEVKALARKLLQARRTFGTYDEVHFVLSFVQQAIRYQREEKEYPRYPVETLVDTIGDCEDFSILGAAILKVMGYDVALLFVPGHCALGVAGAKDMPGTAVEYEGRLYYYCEMSAGGWSLGEIPEEYRDSPVQVNPVPAITVTLDSMSATPPEE